MKLHTFEKPVQNGPRPRRGLCALSFTVLAVAGLSTCIEAGVPPSGPVRIVTAKPGVVPSGTPVVIRTNETVSTRRPSSGTIASRGTIYDASVAEDILDQRGNILIPKESPVELVVRSSWYLGPGGVGMTELTLGLRALTVNGVRYPVETEKEAPDAGGLGVDRQTPAPASGGEGASQLLTSGSRIDVPADTVLEFQTADPIRLRGYRR
jgi:hypothetical protein